MWQQLPSCSCLVHLLIKHRSDVMLPENSFFSSSSMANVFFWFSLQQGLQHPSMYLIRPLEKSITSLALSLAMILDYTMITKGKTPIDFLSLHHLSCFFSLFLTSLINIFIFLGTPQKILFCFSRGSFPGRFILFIFFERY